MCDVCDEDSTLSAARAKDEANAVIVFIGSWNYLPVKFAAM